MNGLDPSGAEASVDAVLGGAIARRAARGALEGRFGASHFLPATTAPLAASAVLVLGLGDPDKFTAERLPELGTALVEAVAALGIRDAATVVHGGGTAAVDSERATRLLMDGLLQALEDVPGAACLRELTLVELDEAKLPAIERGVAAARGSPRVHVYQDVVTLQPRVVDRAGILGAAPDTVPDHLLGPTSLVSSGAGVESPIRTASTLSRYTFAWDESLSQATALTCSARGSATIQMAVEASKAAR